MGEIRPKGILPFTAAADQQLLEGYGVTLSSAGVAVATGATDNVIGVITEGGDIGEQTDVASFGACDRTVHFKAGGAITKGSRLMLMADGTWDCSATGLCCGIASEAAVAGELFEGIPRTPVTIA
jgi:hypothetical protein